MASFWTYEKTLEESKKYNTPIAFENGSPTAYNKALKEGWMKDFIWLVRRTKPKGYWTYERCYEEAKKYIKKTEFHRECSSAYTKAQISGWLKDYTWMLDQTLQTTPCHYVYVYIFKENHAIYVGRTNNPKRRDHDHIFHNDSVSNYAKSQNIAIPEMTILYSNLTALESQIKEDEILNQYKDYGWFIINKGKTGAYIGSLGSYPSKWTYETCYIEAKKYTSRGEFCKNCNGGYKRALRQGWLDEYTWFKPIWGKWTKEACREEAKKYPTSSDFQKYASGAFDKAWNKGWLVEFYPNAKRKKINKQQ